jgi:hypothetical protein
VCHDAKQRINCEVRAFSSHLYSQQQSYNNDGVERIYIQQQAKGHTEQRSVGWVSPK